MCEPPALSVPRSVEASNEGALKAQEHNHDVSKAGSTMHNQLAGDKGNSDTLRECGMAGQLKNRKEDTAQMDVYYNHVFKMTGLLILPILLLIACIHLAPKNTCASRPRTAAPAYGSPRPPRASCVRVADDCFTAECMFHRVELTCNGCLEAGELE